MTESILCIPGKWKDRNDIMLSIVDSNKGKYIFAGLVLFDTEREKAYELLIEERDVQVNTAFRFAGAVTEMKNEEFEQIDQHTFVIYLKGETGDLESAAAIAKATGALLKAGGLGVKVETSGKAFSKEAWMELVEPFEEGNLYELFVLDCISDGDETVYSCGMHNLGFKDTIVSNEEFQKGVDLIRLFGCYQLADKPTIEAGQTFSMTADAPRYRIKIEDHQPNEDHERFRNPYGMWRLEKL